MSYQIKSTPLFRSIVSKSKKTGELQRLRDEYERMKDFNDRTIEMKMRQVRLKRLFREIEEIKETRGPAWRRHRANAHKPKTAEQVRFETLMRAKELGKEYSKLNAIMVERSTAKLETLTGPYPYPEFGYSIGVLRSKHDVERRARSVKRINYGNEISSSNMRKISRTKRRRVEDRESVSYEQPDAKSESEVQLARLRQRIEYGNSWSTINMTKCTTRGRKSKRSSRRLNQQSDYGGPIVPPANTFTEDDSSLLSTSEAQMFVENPPRQHIQNLSGFTTVQEFEVPSMPQIEFFQSIPDEHQRARALQNWHRLSVIVRNGIASISRRGAASSSNQSAPTPTPTKDENSPCLVSDMTSESFDIPMPMDQTNLMNQEPIQCSLEKPTIGEGVVLIDNVSRSSEIFTTPRSYEEPIGKPNSRVQTFIKMFEMSARTSSSSKDDYLLASNKFTSIFETVNDTA